MIGQSPFSSPFSSPAGYGQPTFTQPPPSNRPPEADMPRAVNYIADYSGCGFWRMLWPEHVLNAHQKMISQSSSVMVLQPNFYDGVGTIRIQRQATPHQLKFLHFLKEHAPSARIIYEIDDIVFREDIPDYNKFKFAFESDEIRATTEAIMNMCDEITVTNKFMQKYYQDKVNKAEVTVIPNFPPRFWIGNYYNPQRVKSLFIKHRKKPRILYAGSGAHFDVDNKVKNRDDFEHVNEYIIKTRKKYQWVFLGAFPPPLRPYILNGEMEFHPWQRTYEYPKKIYDLEIQMMVAPLQDNIFNKSKSDLKYIEACCFGLPIACQDMCTYENATLKFKDGKGMIDCIERVVGNPKAYKEGIANRYKVAENRFLELDKNIDCYLELYKYPYGSQERENLAKWQ